MYDRDCWLSSAGSSAAWWRRRQSRSPQFPQPVAEIPADTLAFRFCGAVKGMWFFTTRSKPSQVSASGLPSSLLNTSGRFTTGWDKETNSTGDLVRKNWGSYLTVCHAVSESIDCCFVDRNIMAFKAQSCRPTHLISYQLISSSLWLWEGLNLYSEKKLSAFRDLSGCDLTTWHRGQRSLWLPRKL